MKDSWEVKPAHVTRAELGKYRREESASAGFRGAHFGHEVRVRKEN